MEIGPVLGAVTACVSVGTLVFVAYRERREGNVRAEQRAKAIIDLLRIAENPRDPEAVRQFARAELRRMRAEFASSAEQETLVESVFSSKPLVAANARLASLPIDEPEVMDEDLQRLVNIVRWWTESGMSRQEEWRVRLGFIIMLFVMGFLTLAIGAVRATLILPLG
jgi:hypothetical protein